jgi:hypothetical protein
MNKKSNTLKQLILLLAIIIPLLLLTGCTSEEQQQSDKYTQLFIGTWTYFEGGQLTFTSDKTVTIDDIARLKTMNLQGTYTFAIEDTEITFTNTTNQITFKFSFGENTLTLTDELGGTLTFNKI